METTTNQLSIFGTLIKEDVWGFKLTTTKGNKEKYIDSFECDLNEWLKDNPDRKKVDRFKSCFYSSLFDTHIGRGIYNDMTAAEIYGYEYIELGMNLKGIYIFDKWFYEGSYIHLHNYEGILELVINKMSEDFIEVTHRMGKVRFSKVFNSVNELIKDMWTLEEVKNLDIDLSAKPVNELWFLYSLIELFRNNLNLDNKDIGNYIEDLSKRCCLEMRNREYTESTKLSQKDFLRLISDNIYNHSWDTVRESIDSEPKQKAIANIVKNRANSGQSISQERLTVGSISCDNKGVIVASRDKREFKFSWSQVYESIHENKGPKQLDIFSMLAFQCAV